MENETNSFELHPATKKRLVKDVVDIIKNPLASDGIYYVHDELNILRGYAVIFGPEDTAYEHGAYFFRFHFPHDYPFRPPKVTFITKDLRTRTRFNPNLYINGKVCVSLLNTWKGEQWTSCQTIRSVLLVLVTLFCKNPLLNEPGITEIHRDVDNYRRLIQFKNSQVAICDVLQQYNISQEFVGFMPIIQKYFRDNKTKILSALEKGSESEENGKIITVDVYSMQSYINYDKLKERFLAEISKEN